ncbi:uncharacterized protein K444DRAFT_612963 [Hyaloscypha bicolor E]|uniref:DUF6594 domain-containing protein n=1 Tax=Hyaloscypha bicolor E TaxID=1095630 RepID=A0A2J6TA67_9HELO|nr:uncharacterized protein K444DRAFT_612963 [Hyaloscypha bicolor E]PMD59899.1 hypothetical protein K444DRAFT_612963 [Hyaloscypha bicolor E]
MDSKQNLERDEERDNLLDGLALLPYFERLTHFIRGSTRHLVAGGVTVVDFRPLYTVIVHHLQRQLAEEIQKIEKADITGQQLEDIRGTLHKYTDALRDFEFIHGNRWNTHFVKEIAASRLDDGRGSRLQAALIWDLGLKAPASHRSLFRDSDLLGSFNPKLMQHGTSVGGSLGTGRAQAMAREERRMHFHMALKRFAFAIIGGLIIVVPMLILVVGSATAKTLAVISTSIFLFAVSVAVFSTTEPGNLLAATAAYAAVLMALIGGGHRSNI